MTTIIIGDSHADFCTRKLDKKNVIVNSVPSITMHRIGRDKVLFLNPILINKNNNYIFFFGEIDCRCHIYKQLKLNRSLEEICDTLTTNYINSIKLNIPKYKKIIISCIVPPVNILNYKILHGEFEENFPVPVLGTDEERIQYTKLMNKMLKEKAFKEKFLFLDFYDKYIEEDGTLKNPTPNVHILDSEICCEEIMKLINN